MENYELDVHTHTLASGHAYSTISEMVNEAKNKGLKLLGIVEHDQGIPGTCDPIYFKNLGVEPYVHSDWDGTEEGLYASCSNAAKIIQLNDWKIPDDYPCFKN